MLKCYLRTIVQYKYATDTYRGIFYVVDTKKQLRINYCMLVIIPKPESAISVVLND